VLLLSAARITRSTRPFSRSLVQSLDRSHYAEVAYKLRHAACVRRDGQCPTQQLLLQCYAHFCTPVSHERHATLIINHTA